MTDYSQWGPLLTRRAFLIGALHALGLSFLGVRLYDLQVRRRSHFQTLSDKNRLFIRPLAAQRGILKDCRGRHLAVNVPTFRLVLWADHDYQVKQTLDHLSSFFPLHSCDLARVLQELHAHKERPLQVFVLKDQLSWEEVALIELHIHQLPGLRIEEGLLRHYPLGSTAAHFTGYVERIPLKGHTVPGALTGKTGMELSSNDRLSGHPGASMVEVNAKRHVVRELKHIAPQEGEGITTTLDSTLQTIFMDVLGSLPRAAGVMLDNQGHVLAMASVPSFDPNIFTTGLDAVTWENLRSNPHYPLVNKAVMGLYAPGSLIKMCVALAALEAGIITPDTRIHCPGHYELSGQLFHCWHSWGHGSLNVTQAIAQSCDVFFYEIGRRTGIQSLRETLSQYGLGHNILPCFPGAKSGLLPDPQWKKQKKGLSWNPCDTVLTSIGQGYMLTTLLQLTTMMARLGTGKRIVPSLFPRPLQDTWEELSTPPQFLDVVRAGMFQAVNSPSGTGHRAWMIHAGHPILAGKTGSSQVRRISLQERSSGKHKSFPWMHHDHALFAGYIPYRQPKFFIGILVEHGGSGGRVAAPLARDIFQKWLESPEGPKLF